MREVPGPSEWACWGGRCVRGERLGAGSAAAGDRRRPPHVPASAPTPPAPGILHPAAHPPRASRRPPTRPQLRAGGRDAAVAGAGAERGAWGAWRACSVPRAAAWRGSSCGAAAPRPPHRPVGLRMGALMCTCMDHSLSISPCTRRHPPNPPTPPRSTSWEKARRSRAAPRWRARCARRWTRPAAAACLPPTCTPCPTWACSERSVGGGAVALWRRELRGGLPARRTPAPLGPMPRLMYSLRRAGLRPRAARPAPPPAPDAPRSSARTRPLAQPCCPAPPLPASPPHPLLALLQPAQHRVVHDGDGSV